jgi:hypothetical protein
MISILDYDENYTELVNMNFSSYSNEYRTVKEYYFDRQRTILPAVFRLTIDTVAKAQTRYVNNNRSFKSSNVNPDTLYPIAVRYISLNNVYVIERPPFRVSVDFKNARASWEEDPISPVEIWIPWTVMILPWNDIIAGDPSTVRLFFNDGPMESLSDKIIPGYLPNSYSDGRICWSNSFNNLLSELNLSGPESVDINYLYSSILNDYMMGGWNTDLNFSYQALQYNNSFVIDALQEKDQYPMISLFHNSLNINPTFAENLRSIIENKFGFSKRKSLSFVDGSILRDTNNNQVNRNIYIKLFAFMSSISLSDTLAFVSEIKRAMPNKRTIKELADTNVGYYQNNSNTTLLNASAIPVKQTCIENSIEFEYTSIKAYVVYKKTYNVGVDHINYNTRFGTDFEAILSYENSPEELYELLYLDIYRLCKNQHMFKEDPNKSFVIVVDGDNKTLSIHDESYLSDLFSEVATTIKTNVAQSTISKNSSIVTYIQRYEIKNEQ